MKDIFPILRLTSYLKRFLCAFLVFCAQMQLCLCGYAENKFERKALALMNSHKANTRAITTMQIMLKHANTFGKYNSNAKLHYVSILPFPG